MVVSKMPNPTKEVLLKLMADKAALERKIDDNGEILRANGNVGMNGSLVDDEQFPISTIDVVAVRQARHQIICLQNDHKALMVQIEKLLHKLHTETKEQQGELSRKTEGMNFDDLAEVPSSSNETNRHLAPMAKITLVTDNSPAARAGLKAGDIIYQFGSVNSTNFNKNLSMIQSVVQNMQNRDVGIQVKRDNKMHDLTLVPRVWNGRGLLGCSINLLDDIKR